MRAWRARVSALASLRPPSRMLHRSMMQDLSRSMCVSTKPGTTRLPPITSTWRAFASDGATAAMRPLWMPISTSRSGSAARRACDSTTSKLMVRSPGWPRRRRDRRPPAPDPKPVLPRRRRARCAPIPARSRDPPAARPTPPSGQRAGW